MRLLLEGGPVLLAHRLPSGADGQEAEILCEDISATLNEPLEARPEAADLLRGRTLARMFH